VRWFSLLLDAGVAAGGTRGLALQLRYASIWLRHGGSGAVAVLQARW